MDYVILTWIDYVIILITLCISTIIGSYFGFVKKKSSESRAQEYLDGGNNLKVFPVAVSICSSTISSIGFLGVVAENYEYGLHHLLGSLMIVAGAYIAFILYVPVFHKLKLSSMYEYLEGRFDKNIRTLCAILFILESTIFSGVVVYCSSIGISRMSGINIHYINLASCGVCIFYTMLGGLKGVIWTDTLQAWIMVGSMTAIVIMGLIRVGSISQVVETVVEGDRLQLDFTLNPFVRTSVWAACIGQMWFMTNLIFFNQSTIQRLNAIPKLKNVKRTCIIVGFGCFFLLVLSHACGLVLYVLYADCDPITSKQIVKVEEILPHFIVEYTSHIPGFAGIFLAGLLSSSLSTMSAKLNSTAGIIYNDFILKIYTKPMSDSTITLILKITTIIVGILCFFTGFMIDKMGQILQVCVSLQSICYGAMAGLFSLGMLVPQCTIKGAYTGAIVSALTIGFVTIGSNLAVMNGTLIYPKLPVSIEGCENITSIANTTLITNPDDTYEDDTFILFKTSFYYLSLFGTIITVVVGYVVSYFTGFQDLSKVHPDYVASFLQEWLKRQVGTNRANREHESKLLNVTTDCTKS